MGIEQSWEKALRNTEIMRSRVQALLTFRDTRVPYIFLAESTVNLGDTLVRKGEVMVQRPSLILPPNMPQFAGFELDTDEKIDQNNFINFLLVRGVSVPSFKYNNRTSTIDIYEGKLKDAIEHYMDFLQQRENVDTGLITGPEDCWQFSVLIFVCSQIAKNAETDIKKLLDEYHKKKQ